MKYFMWNRKNKSMLDVPGGNPGTRLPWPWLWCSTCIWICSSVLSWYSLGLYGYKVLKLHESFSHQESRVLQKDTCYKRWYSPSKYSSSFHKQIPAQLLENYHKPQQSAGRLKDIRVQNVCGFWFVSKTKYLLQRNNAHHLACTFQLLFRDSLLVSCGLPSSFSCKLSCQEISHSRTW